MSLSTDGSNLKPSDIGSSPPIRSPVVEHSTIENRTTAATEGVFDKPKESATESLPVAQNLTAEESGVSFKTELAPAAPGQSPAHIQVSIPDMSLEKVKERGQKAATQSIEFGEQWLSENRAHPAIQGLEVGQGFALSRREIQQLAKEGQLSPSLSKLYASQGFPRSVVLVKVAENTYEFTAKRHEHVLEGERGSSTRAHSEMESHDSLKKILGEGGINELVCLDAKTGETVDLHRQTIARDPDTIGRLIKQQKSEEALKDVPHVFNRKCMSKNIEASKLPPGVRPLQGAVYVKMAMDGKKYFNCITKDKAITLGDPPQPAPPQKALKALHQISQGMASMHEKNIAWRDMKLENLLVDADGNVHIADFDTCAHLDNPTDKTVKNPVTDEEKTINELSQLDIEGTPLLVAPWIAGLATSAVVKSPLSDRVKATKERLASATDIEVKRSIVAPFLKKGDTYTLALTTYLLMTGEYPSFFKANIAHPFAGFNPSMLVSKNNRDRDLTPSEDPINLPEGCEWIPKNLPDPLTQNASDLIEGLNQAIKNGYPQEVVELVWKGLSTNPDEVPTAQEFRDTSRKFLQA